ncbi:ATP synthase F0 subcomplex A subunit [Polaribacter sp. Hel1_33_78]|jgi:F-type H+-transporting ATPase subunit a|uniref:F0F1 ATP synthase subunit A n=1 Tax=unclassified Polaribacter TaxID=196858 RepID=UPI00087B698B|nr:MULTISPECIES: F0F1 ATP synthase subunit A [unclassified Polaribacter]MBT3741173.1 F0F1 ATP synthase subunit A [Polaribacter sp.]MBT7816439.1 F0F1 ATP synthase subunit A [Polaribacter sp.]MDG1404221.1 F0F1 ATP synthase subunit A [Polaribacter sp.]SDT86598.1 ATP synthase F0 subcomplex A subunit [Polaribacter sp. Hel1_33_78]
MKIAEKTVRFLTIAMIALFTAAGFAAVTDKKQDIQNDGGRVNTKEEVEAYILHHIKDSHDFSLWSYTSDEGERKHVGFPLPVILWTSKGLVTFMSSEFHHNDDGHVIVEKDGLKFAKIHSKIFELDNNAVTISFDETHHATNAHKLLDFSITKSVVGILFIGFLLLFWFSRLAKQYKTKQIPTGFARVLEPLVLYVRDEIARPNIGDKHYRRFTGYLLTVFFFIWVLNLAGLTPLGFNVTGQLAVTGCLAIFTLVIYTVSGNKDYWMHMIWMPGVPVLIRPVLAIIELAGALIIKPFSLLVRLFANISAGHIVVMSLIAIMFTLKESLGVVGATGLSLVLSFFITLIEVLVAFLQAYIFTMLSALFIGMAVADHSEAH